MNKRIHQAVWALLCVVLVAACSSGDSVGDRAGSDESPGRLVARIDLGAEKSVSFYEVPNYGILTMAKGPAGGPIVDRAAIDGKPLADTYRILSGGQEPPAALLDAAKRWNQLDGEAAHISAPPDVAESAASSLTPNGKLPQSIGNAPGKKPQDFWSDDAAWFVANYCQGTFDYKWCTTGFVTWVHSGWGTKAKYYEAAGATTDGTATMWIDWWNGSGWQRLATTNLGTWGATYLFGRGPYYYRSGIDGTPNRILYFAEKLRYAIPTITEYVGDSPNNRSYGNFSDDIQGVTHDANNWYLTRNSTNLLDHAEYGLIAKQGFTSFNEDPSLVYRMPVSWQNEGMRHFGDLVESAGNLYVAMDDNDNGASVAVFRASDLATFGYRRLDTAHWPSGGIAFWAFNPRDQHFYTLFNDCKTLKVYDISPFGPTVTWLRDIPLIDKNGIPTSVANGVQGGKISVHGNLYLSVGWDTSSFGIYMIDTVDGYVQTFYPVNKGAADEFEGIDVIDLDADGRLPSPARGQLHLQQMNIAPGPSSDDLWWAHFRVDNPGAL